MTGTALSPSVCFGEAILDLLLLEQSTSRSGRATSQAQRPCLYCHMHRPRISVIQQCFFKATIEVRLLHSSINISGLLCYLPCLQCLLFLPQLGSLLVCQVVFHPPQWPLSSVPHSVVGTVAWGQEPWWPVPATCHT